jgi:glycosyltransferase involved in cell wall biosynthesis
MFKKSIDHIKAKGFRSFIQAVLLKLVSIAEKHKKIEIEEKNANPLEMPLSERIKMLTCDKFRIAYFRETPDYGSFSYYAYTAVQAAIEGQNIDLAASYFSIAEKHKRIKIEEKYKNPWDIPLSERIKMLMGKNIRIAYFRETPDYGSFRYRAYNMAQVLNEQQNIDVSASYFFIDDLCFVDEIVELADILVICRARYCNRINELVRKFKMSGKKVFFDIDDFFFDIQYVDLIINSCGHSENNTDFDFWFSNIGRVRELMRLCDSVIATNQYLADKISESLGISTSVIPNFINKEQLHISNEIFKEKQQRKLISNNKICFGYFSGTRSHNKDFQIVTPALIELLKQNNEIELVLVGHLDIDKKFEMFSDRVIRYPLQDYLSLQRLIGNVEFNLVPLQENVFTDCKSELKYFEAAIVGTLSIASPTRTYVSAIQDGENGYISQAYEWHDRIKYAIDNIDSYSQMAETAHADALKKYAYHMQADTILNVLLGG